ncbi:MAG: hypothetical protein RL216_512 [Pseudomonadota bacterium]|jgi:uncharacterized membrane protein
MKKPMLPWIVLALAVLLPGVGHVVSRQPMRGLIFLFFIILLGAFTVKTASPDVSVVGKYAGGLFVWAMSILDAYRIGRIRYEVWRHQA